MGLLNLVKSGIGLAGKVIGDAANHFTGGLAGKVGSAITENSGLVGKIAGAVGRAVVPSKVRNALSTVADAALEIIPEGKVKTALKKMNDVAQNRGTDISTAKTNQYKSSNSTIAAGEGTIYGGATVPRSTSANVVSIPTPTSVVNTSATGASVTSHRKTRARLKTDSLSKKHLRREAPEQMRRRNKRGKKR